MPESTSNVEFAHKIHESGHHHASPADRRAQWVEIVEAVVLAIGRFHCVKRLPGNEVGCPLKRILQPGVEQHSDVAGESYTSRAGPSLRHYNLRWLGRREGVRQRQVGSILRTPIPA